MNLNFMNRIIIGTLFLVVSHTRAQAQFTENADSAFAFAKERNKAVLLVFSGSDWCVPCMRFEKKILKDPLFLHFSDSTLILLNADFPQSKKLPPQIVKQDEALAEKYNPSGSFPLIVLLRSDKRVLAYLKYQNENAQEFISAINQYLL